MSKDELKLISEMALRAEAMRKIHQDMLARGPVWFRRTRLV